MGTRAPARTPVAMQGGDSRGKGASLPYESVATLEIYHNHNKSVVRLRILKQDSERGQKYSYGTGFISHNSARKLLIMTCAHLFGARGWVKGSPVEVTFHDQKRALAYMKICVEEEEVAILHVSPMDTELQNVRKYPVVEFFYTAVKEGDPLVMLGYPFSKKGEVDLGSFFGSVTNRAALTGKTKDADPSEYFELVLSDYDGAGGSSGAPVFRCHEGKVAGISVCGSKEVMCFVPVRAIHRALRGTKQVRGSQLGTNASIRQMLERIASCESSPSVAGAGAAAGSSGSGTAPSRGVGR
ncbi:uncharacterized protein LOC119297367 [Triticum dicoccoides]|uniref:uncharacterized protein LOC119297367 n=1 Tax=Triticum dicoccoides TaxID=85692 RepID=UPI000E78A342|nr:uncharacterized protein LOC119297367 [Triticum dicoccoides]